MLKAGKYISVLFAVFFYSTAFAKTNCGGDFEKQVVIFTDKVNAVASKHDKFKNEGGGKLSVELLAHEYVVYVLYTITAMALDADSWFGIECKMKCVREDEAKSDPLGDQYVGLMGRCAVAGEALEKCIKIMSGLGKTEMADELTRIRTDFELFQRLMFTELTG